MSVSQQQLVCDSSTLANFKQWAQAISAFFATAGWIQASDTGQVNWSSIAAVPGAAAFVYEIWKPNDGLTNFFTKIEYGNVSGTNSPTIRISAGTGTNGSGTLTGFVTGVLSTISAGPIAPPSTVTQYECDFSGDSGGRLGGLMWRNAPNSAPSLFVIERSLNSAGGYTGDYITLITGGFSGVTPKAFTQQSLVFAIGAGNASPANNNNGGLITVGRATGGGSDAFGGNVPVGPVFPDVGVIGNPMTALASVNGGDISEGVIFTASLYGVTHTYLPTKAGQLSTAGPCQTLGFAACLRYD